MNVWHVQAPGMLTSVQDRGRTGLRHLGIARGGALDTVSAWLANALVGNDDDCAVLEMTLSGPVLQLAQPAEVALTGALMEASADGWPVPMNRPVTLPACTLTLGATRNGARSYLSVAGGFATCPALGSRSTDLRGAFGGFQGRALCAGDELPVGAPTLDRVAAPSAPAWWINDDFPAQPEAWPVRFVPSPHPATKALDQRDWRVSPRSDRQGLRLQGEPMVTVVRSETSEPVSPGCIQLPPDGHPIVLLADAQTVGGYPRLGHVIAADLPRLAQLKPGEHLRFTAVSLDQAYRAGCAARERMAKIAIAIRARA